VFVTTSRLFVAIATAANRGMYGPFVVQFIEEKGPYGVCFRVSCDNFRRDTAVTFTAHEAAVRVAHKQLSYDNCTH